MRIAISNIAWDTPEDEAVATCLRQRGVDAVDIAPSKYFPRAAEATETEIDQVRKWWAARGIAITGMQALLFSVTSLNVFGTADVQRALLDHLASICRIAGRLGATNLVFGAPRNRDRSGLNDEQAMEIAVGFFRQLGDIAERAGVTMCLEPNPPRYGANFMTTSQETARVVEAVAHPAIRMQLDTGALLVNGEDVVEAVSRTKHLVAHIHASEPDLVPLGDSSADHKALGKVIRERLPDRVVCIEMVATKNEPHLTAIERALDTALSAYRHGE